MCHWKMRVTKLAPRSHSNNLIDHFVCLPSCAGSISERRTFVSHEFCYTYSMIYGMSDSKSMHKRVFTCKFAWYIIIQCENHFGGHCLRENTNQYTVIYCSIVRSNAIMDSGRFCIIWTPNFKLNLSGKLLNWSI